MRFNHLSMANIKPKVATFAFDNTITQMKWDFRSKRWVAGLDPNMYTISEIYRLAADDWTIRVVTCREHNPANKALIKKYCEHFMIPLDAVFCTGGYKRAKVIKALNSSVHFDHDWDELMFLAEHFPEIVGIRVPLHNEDEFQILS